MEQKQQLASSVFDKPTQIKIQEQKRAGTDQIGESDIKSGATTKKQLMSQSTTNKSANKYTPPILQSPSGTTTMNRIVSQDEITHQLNIRDPGRGTLNFQASPTTELYNRAGTKNASMLDLLLSNYDSEPVPQIEENGAPKTPLATQLNNVAHPKHAQHISQSGVEIAFEKSKADDISKSSETRSKFVRKHYTKFENQPIKTFQFPQDFLKSNNGIRTDINSKESNRPVPWKGNQQISQNLRPNVYSKGSYGQQSKSSKRTPTSGGVISFQGQEIGVGDLLSYSKENNQVIIPAPQPTEKQKWIIDELKKQVAKAPDPSDMSIESVIKMKVKTVRKEGAEPQVQTIQDSKNNSSSDKRKEDSVMQWKFQNETLNSQRTNSLGPNSQLESQKNSSALQEPSRSFNIFQRSYEHYNPHTHNISILDSNQLQESKFTTNLKDSTQIDAGDSKQSHLFQFSFRKGQQTDNVPTKLLGQIANLKFESPQIGDDAHKSRSFRNINMSQLRGATPTADTKFMTRRRQNQSQMRTRPSRDGYKDKFSQSNVSPKNFLMGVRNSITNTNTGYTQTASGGQTEGRSTRSRGPLTDIRSTQISGMSEGQEQTQAKRMKPRYFASRNETHRRSVMTKASPRNLSRPLSQLGDELDASDAVQRELNSLKSMKEFKQQNLKRKIEQQHNRLILNLGMSYNRITLEKIQKQKEMLATEAGIQQCQHSAATPQPVTVSDIIKSPYKKPPTKMSVSRVHKVGDKPIIDIQSSKIDYCQKPQTSQLHQRKLNRLHDVRERMVNNSAINIEEKGVHNLQSPMSFQQQGPSPYKSQNMLQQYRQMRCSTQHTKHRGSPTPDKGCMQQSFLDGISPLNSSQNPNFRLKSQDYIKNQQKKEPKKKKEQKEKEPKRDQYLIQYIGDPGLYDQSIEMSKDAGVQPNAFNQMGAHQRLGDFNEMQLKSFQHTPNQKLVCSSNVHSNLSEDELI